MEFKKREIITFKRQDAEIKRFVGEWGLELKKILMTAMTLEGNRKRTSIVSFFLSKRRNKLSVERKNYPRSECICV